MEWSRKTKELTMNPIGLILLLVIAPVIALYIGCLGVEMIEETILGWLLVMVGVGYPAGAVIIYYRKTHFLNPR
jgi:hypothetical protein